MEKIIKILFYKNIRNLNILDFSEIKDGDINELYDFSKSNKHNYFLGDVNNSPNIKKSDFFKLNFYDIVFYKLPSKFNNIKELINISDNVGKDKCICLFTTSFSNKNECDEYINNLVLSEDFKIYKLNSKKILLYKNINVVQILKEELRKEELRKEELRKEELRKEKLRKEELRKEKLRKEKLRKEELRKEELRKEKLRKEELKKNKLRKEELKKEELKKNKLRKENKYGKLSLNEPKKNTSQKNPFTLKKEKEIIKKENVVDVSQKKENNFKKEVLKKVKRFINIRPRL